MMVYLPVTHVTPNIRDQNCRERLGKSLDHFHSYFFGRERDRKCESQSEKQNMYYGISGTEYFDQEYDRELVIYNGNTIITT